MRKILMIATTRLCKDGLTEVALRVAQIAGERAEIGFALAEGCDATTEAELRKLGRVYPLPSRKKRLPAYLLSLRKLVRREKYEVVHIHGNSATMAFDLLGAWAGGAMIRITHVHNCAQQSWLKQKTLGTALNSLVTCPVACSQASGEMLYTRPFTVLRNCVDCQRFMFSENVRSSVRRELRVEDAFVIGHIGRFSAQKNQSRLLRIFAELLHTRPDAVLLLCGEGESMERCRREAEKLRIADKVLFAGKVEQPQRYYQAMDVFVLPSLFEGLPLVGIEAQASGLPCVFSDAITEETRIIPECVFLPLKESDHLWAEKILSVTVPNRAEAVLYVEQAGYTDAVLRDQVRELYEKV